MSESFKRLSVIVSIHDVMPETLRDVDNILDWLEAHCAGPVTLLVVPGRNWKSWQLDWLREQQLKGVTLAGHGWQHGVDQRRTLYHKLHGMLLSRMAAEHLLLDEQGIVDLINRCFDWFVAHDFLPPSLYVPPAWAMGRIRTGRLDSLPFRLYESLSGIYCTSGRSAISLPLAGYEADTALRAGFLVAWNRVNELRARRCGKPLRISIHPGDLTLRLSTSLAAQLRAAERFLDYAAVAACSESGGGELARY